MGHRFEDGGGRELAYVALSRGREANWSWVVADNAEQAAGDLRAEWGRQRRERWVLDTDQPVSAVEAAAADRAALPRPAAEAVLRRRLAAEQAAVNAVIPHDTTAALQAAQGQLVDIEQRRSWLSQTVADPHRIGEDNPYRQGPLHQAAIAAVDADLAHRVALAAAADPKLGLIDRRRTRRQLEAAEVAAAPAQARLERLVAVQEAWLDGRADRAGRRHDHAAAALAERQAWLRQHSVARVRLARIADDLADLDRLTETEREAAALDTQADQLARQRPAATAIANHRAAETEAARRVDELQAQLAARWTGRLRGDVRQQAKTELDQLRTDHPDLSYPPEWRAQRWDQRQTAAQQQDHTDVAQLRSQADQARADNQHTWQHLCRPAPAPLPTPSLDRQPEAAKVVYPQHHPTMQLQPGGPQPGWYHQPLPHPEQIQPGIGLDF